MSVFQLVLSFLLCYLYLRWLPHLYAVVNHVRVGSYFSVFYAALLLIIMAYHPGVDVNDWDARKRQQCVTAARFLRAIAARRQHARPRPQPRCTTSPLQVADHLRAVGWVHPRGRAGRSGLPAPHALLPSHRGQQVQVRQRRQALLIQQ